MDLLHHRAAGVELLSDEQRQLLEQELVHIGVQDIALEQQITAQQQRLNWLQQWQNIQQKHQQYQQQVAQVEQQTREAEPQLSQLTRSEPAEKLRPLLNERERYARELQDLQSSIAQLGAQQQQHQESMSQLTLALDNAVQAQKQQADAKQQQEKQIDTQVLPLDNAITKSEEKCLELTQNLAQQQQKYQQVSQNLQKIEAEQAQLTQQTRQFSAKESELNAALKLHIEQQNVLEAQSPQTALRQRLTELAELRPVRQQLSTLLPLYQQLSQRIGHQQTEFNTRQVELQAAEERLKSAREQYKQQKQQQNDVEKLHEQAQLIVSLEAERARLQTGCACPLCGSTSHPAIEQYQAVKPLETALRLDLLRQQTEALKTTGIELNTRTEGLKEQQQRLQTSLDRDIQQQAEYLGQWQQACAKLSLTFGPENAEALQHWLAECEQEEQRSQQTLRQHDDAQQALQRAKETLYSAQNEQQKVQQQVLLLAERRAAGEKMQADEQQALSRLTAQQAETEQSLVRQRAERHSLFGDKQVTQVREQLHQQQLAAEQAHHQASQALLAVQKQLDRLGGQLLSLQQSQRQGETHLQHAQTQWQQALETSAFGDEQAVLEALIDESLRQQLQQLKDRLQQQQTQSHALLQQATEQRQQHLKSRPDGTDEQQSNADTLAQQLAELAAQLRVLQQRQGELRSQLDSDRQRQAGQHALFAQIAQSQEQFDDWSYLNQILGSSDGAKFRKFAQGLTLEHLVYLANKQMDKLHGRYLLQRKTSDALELEVVDTWQADAVRDTRTLSGGESFLVSLALALALSDLVSDKTRIDSLFLDEGFGTLDADTLDTALDALDSLNASGKTIGVISHVEAMKDRIPVQIKVKKVNGLGISRLDSVFRVEG